MKKYLLPLALLFLALDGMAQNTNPKIDSLKQLLAQPQPDTTLFELYTELAKTNQYKHADSAIYYSALALPYGERIGGKHLGVGYKNYASYLGMSGLKPDSAIHYFTLAKRIFEEQDDLLNVARIGQGMGNTYSGQAYYYLATEAFIDGLRALDGLSAEEHPIANNLRASILVNLGKVAVMREQLPEALNYYAQSLLISLAINNVPTEANAYMGLGAIYEKLSMFDSATYYAEKTLALAEQHQVVSFIANQYLNLGYIAIRQENYGEAADLLNKSIQVYLDAGFEDNLATAYLNLGLALAGQGRYSQALAQTEKGLAFAEKNNALDAIAVAHKNLGEIYEQAGQPKKSIQHFQEHIAYKDSLRTLENARQLDELNTQYQTSQRIAKINELNYKNDLAKAEAEQERLYRYGLSGLLLVFILAVPMGFTLVRQRQRLRIKGLEQEQVAKENTYKSQMGANLHNGAAADLRLQIQALEETGAADATWFTVTNRVVGEIRSMSKSLQYRGVASGNLAHDLVRYCNLTN